MSVGPEPTDAVRDSAEARDRARQSVREMLASVPARARPAPWWTVPLAAAAAVTAAACAPLVWPLLTAGSAAVLVQAAIGQVGGVGSNLLTEVVIRAWNRLRARVGSARTEGQLRDELAGELEASLSLETVEAAGLRSEVARVMQRVDAVGVALTATVGGSTGALHAELAEGFRGLGQGFTEFRWVLDAHGQQLADIASTAHQILTEVIGLRQEGRVSAGYENTLRSSRSIKGVTSLFADRVNDMANIEEELKLPRDLRESRADA